MNNIKKFFALGLCVVVSTISLLASTSANIENTPKVKYVFLFIGDGMSLPQRMMTECFLMSQNASSLTMDSFPNQAITRTHSANSLVTDSAAGGTALACGTKTDNGTLGLNPAGEKLESIAVCAKKGGKRVGIITSVTINHATPASFYAHNKKRGDYYSIGLEMIESNFDFFGGGGIADSDNKSHKLYKGDLYSLAEKSSYKLARTSGEIKNLTSDDAKIMILPFSGAIPPRIDEPNAFSLAEITAKAVELLDSEKGFFIMVEGGAIDWMCHSNDAGALLGEMFDFDNAIKVAVEFAKKHPNETLIVVTADHETGGLTLGNGAAKYVKSANYSFSNYKMPIERLAEQKISAAAFTKKIDSEIEKNPNFAFDDAKDIIEKSFGLKFSGNSTMTLSEGEIDVLEDSFKIKNGKISDSFVGNILKLFSGRAGIAWTGHAHTGLPVITTASGKGADAFNGFIDNTDVAKILKKSVR